MWFRKNDEKFEFTKVFLSSIVLLAMRRRLFAKMRRRKKLKLLTLYYLAWHICDAVPKFYFQFKNGSRKKNYERRDYESVDENSLS